ncbi:MAG: protein translocase subunit SecF [Fibrobacterota bacterium]
MNNTTFNINFVGNRKTAVIVSGVLILVTVLALIIRRGPNYSIDFTGGTSVTIALENRDLTADKDKIREKIQELNFSGFGEPKVIKDGSRSMIQITVKQKDSEEGKIKAMILDKMNDLYPEIKKSNISAEEVGSKVGSELTSNALWAIFLSLVVIVLYIAFRFKFAYGLGAIAALVHDILITIGLFAVLDWEVSLPIIAAILTIVGYSLNDTIVLFDRIRENLTEHLDKKMSLSDTLNISINQTLSRTLITSLTTLFVVFAIFVVFIPTENILKYFSGALLVGIISGTYSSIFVATTVLLYLSKKWPITEAESTGKK